MADVKANEEAVGLTSAYRTARDELLSLREDYAGAVAGFEWPAIRGRFNWAFDWFETFARQNPKPGLIVVEEDGSSLTRSFGELSLASNRLARWLARQGVAKGDHVILMLGNQVELWESMLALIKLGAVTMPTTTALGSGDLADRVRRGAARHVICNAADAPKFDAVPGKVHPAQRGAGRGLAGSTGGFR